VIQLEQIGKRYAAPDGGAIDALASVSLTIARGEFVAVTGTSGSGKSTLMNVLGLLDEPTQGRYTFEGQEVSRLSAAERARFRNKNIGFVFQAFHLSPATALENVELRSSTPTAVDRRPGTACARRREVVDRISHKPGELSGSQQQRHIARARQRADLILADEPTENLDPQSAGECSACYSSARAGG
jgi:ABC-type lipoprotein export system ATPase subunit